MGSCTSGGCVGVGAGRAAAVRGVGGVGWDAEAQGLGQ